MTRMTGAEILAEVDWLLEGGVHPAMVAQVVGRGLHSIDRLARRHGRDDIAQLFSREYARDRQWKKKAA